MLYFLLAWIGLLSVSYPVGTGLLNRLQADCFARRGDRFIAATWLGTIVFAISLLAIAFVVPLSLLVGIGVAIILAGLSLIDPRTRTEVLSSLRQLHPYQVMGAIAVLVAAAAATTQPITWFDTGLYHLGSTRWLSTFGVVPGASLVNPRFGFTSSWFALSAPLSDSILGDRVGAVANGFLLAMVILQLAIALNQLLRDKQHLSDGFLAIISIAPIAAYFLVYGSPILISLSTDVPVNMTGAMMAWTMVVIAGNAREDSPFDARAIPLILGAGAVTMKLSALPLLPISYGFYVFGRQQRWKRALLGAAVAGTMFLPMLGYGILTAGCPLFPSRLMCLDLPWSLPVQETIGQTKAINTWEKSAESVQAEAAGEVNSPRESRTGKFIRVLQQRFEQKKFRVMVLMAAVSLGCTLLLIKAVRSDRRNRGELWIIALGAVGMTFIFILGPLLRFGLTYFLVIPSLAISPSSLAAIASQGRGWQGKIGKPMLLYPLILGVVIVVVLASEARSRLWLPASLPQVEVVAETIDGLEYTYPVQGVACWGAKLPCAWEPIPPEVHLRHPERGVAGGFVRRD